MTEKAYSEQQGSERKWTERTDLPEGPYYGRQKVRRQGVTAGTFFWPLGFCFFHVLVQAISFHFARIASELLGRHGNGLAEETMRRNTDASAWGTLVYGIALSLGYFFFLRQQSKREPRYFLTERPRAFDTVLSVVMIIGTLGVSNLCMNMMVALQDQIPFIREQLGEYQKLVGAILNPSQPFVALLGTVIFVPICEELLFRGIIFGELKRVMPARFAIPLTAFLFALFHFQFVQSFYVFFAGFVLTYAYYCTGSMTVPILLHMIYNFLGGGISLLLPENSLPLVIVYLVCLLFVPLAFLSLFLLWRRHRFDPPKSSRVLCFPYRGRPALFEDEEQLLNLSVREKARRRIGAEETPSFAELCAKTQLVRENAERAYARFQEEKKQLDEEAERLAAAWDEEQLRALLARRKELDEKIKALEAETEAAYFPYRF